jgi:hypothetical protein
MKQKYRLLIVIFIFSYNFVFGEDIINIWAYTSDIEERNHEINYIYERLIFYRNNSGEWQMFSDDNTVHIYGFEYTETSIILKNNIMAEFDMVFNYRITNNSFFITPYDDFAHFIVGKEKIFVRETEKYNTSTENMTGIYSYKDKYNFIDEEIEIFDKEGGQYRINHYYYDGFPEIINKSIAITYNIDETIIDGIYFNGYIDMYGENTNLKSYFKYINGDILLSIFPTYLTEEGYEHHLLLYKTVTHSDMQMRK